MPVTLLDHHRDGVAGAELRRLQRRHARIAGILGGLRQRADEQLAAGEVPAGLCHAIRAYDLERRRIERLIDDL
jgi:hypothetical protein